MPFLEVRYLPVSIAPAIFFPSTARTRNLYVHRLSEGHVTFAARCLINCNFRISYVVLSVTNCGV